LVGADITKTFVGAEVMLLSSEGKIDLDALVTQYVTLPFATNGATIRQLATMTSGFPGVPDGAVNAQVAKDLSHAWTAAELVALVKDQPRQGTPGPSGVVRAPGGHRRRQRPFHRRLSGRWRTLDLGTDEYQHVGIRNPDSITPRGRGTRG
jgi:hypothetical protein